MSVKKKVSKLLYGEGPKRSRYIGQGVKSYGAKGALAGGVGGRIIDAADSLGGGMTGTHVGNIAEDMALGGGAGALVGAYKGNKAYKAALKKHKMRKKLVNAGLGLGAVGAALGGASSMNKKAMAGKMSFIAGPQNKALRQNLIAGKKAGKSDALQFLKFNKKALNKTAMAMPAGKTKALDNHPALKGKQKSALPDKVQALIIKKKMQKTASPLAAAALAPSVLGAAGGYTTSDRGAGGRGAVGGMLAGPVGAAGGVLGGAALGAAGGAAIGAARELAREGAFKTLMKRKPKKAKGFLKRLLSARDARSLANAKANIKAEMVDTAKLYGKRGAIGAGLIGLPLGALGAGAALGATMGRRDGAKTKYQDRTVRRR